MAPQIATPFIRWLYSLTLVSILLPASPLGVSGAVGMVYGIGMLSGRSVVLLLIAVALVYRIVQVARFPTALDMNITHRTVRTLRAGGVMLMCVGLSAALLIVLGAAKPTYFQFLAKAILQNPNGVKAAGLVGDLARSAAFLIC